MTPSQMVVVSVACSAAELLLPLSIHAVHVANAFGPMAVSQDAKAKATHQSLGKILVEAAIVAVAADEEKKAAAAAAVLAACKLAKVQKKTAAKALGPLSPFSQAVYVFWFYWIKLTSSSCWSN